MKLLLTTIFVSLLVITTQAQQTATLKGKLVDTTGKQNLLNASVSLLDISDSTLEQFTLTKDDGSFSMKNIPFGTFLLSISFEGFKTVYKKLEFNANSIDKNIGIIYLQQKVETLGEVVITQSPVIIKKDTIEYNASSFKTKPNSLAEDLLKKMPGMQVDKDGNIKAAGEQVQRVLVDGKRFFGDDPKMATKNLPSDVIDKIQVFDALSDQSTFTGFDDGNRTKTINIITKKDKRKGWFGKGSVGLGSDGDQLLNDHNVNVSNFNNGRQITITGQGNNVNKQNFSVQDFLGTLGNSGGNVRGFGGGGGRSGGGMASMVQALVGSNGGGGIVNTWSGGLNYSDDLGGTNSKRNELNGSGFYNNQRTNRTSNSYTENLTSGQPDSSIFSSQLQSSITHNKNGRFSFNIEKELDSLGTNSFIFRPNISFQNTIKSSESSTNSTKSKTIQLTNSNARTGSENTGYNGNIDFTFRHRFKKKGRTVSLNTSLGRNDNDGNGNNYSLNDYYKNGTVTRIDTIDQNYISYSSTKNYGTTLSYTEPVGKFSQIEIAYNHNYSQTESDKKTFSYDDVIKGYITPVANLTNEFRNTYKSDRGTVSYRLTKTKFNFTIGNGIQWGNLNSVNKTTGNIIIQDYINLFPTANFNYTFTKTKNLRFNYSGRTSQPSVTQLQPVLDNSDPLNIKLGNPDLKQKFTHNFRGFYTSFNILTQKVFFATVNASFVSNDIQNSVIVANNGVQITRPVNLNGTYNIVGYVNYGFPLRKPKSNLNLGLNYTRLQSQTLINDISNYSRNTTLGTNIIWTTNLKEKWDINFTSNTTYNIARYTLQPTQDADYFSQYLSVEGTYYTKSGWSFSTDFDYTYNGGRSDGFNTSIPLLNFSIAKQVFKNKAGEVKLYMFDLLNQNQSTTRNISSNYIQDLDTKVLTKYFVISFTYNLRKFKGQNNSGNPPMMRMFKGMGRSGGGMGMQ
ncbi:MAG: outer membrane beta-barrel protein [Chitinophagaceae bacterium]